MRGRLFFSVMGVFLVLLFALLPQLGFADDLIREDNIVDYQAPDVYICGDQAVANQYNASGRYVTYSDDSPPYSVRHTVTSAQVAGGVGGCLDSVALTFSPSIVSGSGTLRLYAADTTPPTISSLTAGSITQTGATVTWTTNESATHTVKYGTTSGSYDSYPNTKSAGSGTSASASL